MAKILLLLALVMFCQIFQDLACQQPTTTPKRPKTTTPTRRKKLKELSREYWKVPANLSEQFLAYRLAYQANRTRMKKLEEESEPPEGMVLHDDFIGYGAGYTGQETPPWAKMENMHGKPNYCFEEPDVGECYENMTSWGYNYNMKECQQFTYSGCGGNYNNFHTKDACEEACLIPTNPQCNKEEEYKEYDVNDNPYRPTASDI